MAAAQVKKSAQVSSSVGVTPVTVFKNTEFHPYYTCRVKFRGILYSSVMHAMAALRFKNKFRWSYGEDFDDWEEIRADINEELLAEGKDKETFHNMGDLIGILAEHVRVRPRRYKLERCKFPAFAYEAALFDVYGAKFMTNGKPNGLGKSLLDTTGRIKINGKRFSTFGKILTKWRDEQKELLGKRKREEDEVEFVKKRTIEDKFADAAASGSMVDLASEDAPAAPAAPAYKSMPAYSNLFGSDDEAEAEPEEAEEAELLCVPPVKVTRKNFLTYYPAWVIKEVVRKGGASAGHIDYHYISPSGKVLRSIKEVVGSYF